MATSTSKPLDLISLQKLPAVRRENLIRNIVRKKLQLEAALDLFLAIVSYSRAHDNNAKETTWNQRSGSPTLNEYRFTINVKVLMARLLSNPCEC